MNWISGSTASVTEVPGGRLENVPALSGFRSLFKYSGRPLLRLADARKYSDHAVAFEVLGLSYVLLFEPKTIEQVLLTQHSAFTKDRLTLDLRRVLGTGLLTSDGETWRRDRKLMAPFFQPSEVAAYGTVMTESAQSCVDRCATGETFDVHSAMMQLTLEVLVRSLFGADLPRAGEVERLIGPLMRDFRPTAVAWRLFLPEWLPVPSRTRLNRTRRGLDSIVNELIAARRRQPAPADRAPPLEASSSRTASERAATNGRATDLLGRLMMARDIEGSLSEAALRDETMTLFLAGHETTALALTYTLRLLALHPEYTRAIRSELAQVMEGPLPTTRDLPKLIRLRAVLDESLRLYPPVWAFARTPREDVVVNQVEIAAVTQVIVSPWSLHRDPRFFEAPERFWPERWLERPSPPRFSYLPFGAGPRVCIGSHFALTEAALILATIVQNCDIELEPDPPLELSPSITLRPRGPVPMRWRRRA